MSVAKKKSAKRPKLRRRPAHQFPRSKVAPVEPAALVVGQPPPNRFLISKAELVEKVGLSFPSIWRKVQLSQFPEPVEIGSKVAWYLDEVEAWLNALPRRSYKTAEG